MREMRNNTKNLSQHSWSPGPELNLGPPDYEYWLLRRDVRYYTTWYCNLCGLDRICQVFRRLSIRTLFHSERLSQKQARDGAMLTSYHYIVSFESSVLIMIRSPWTCLGDMRSGVKWNVRLGSASSCSFIAVNITAWSVPDWSLTVP
jgi:hypothetical protein